MNLRNVTDKNEATVAGRWVRGGARRLEGVRKRESRKEELD